MPQLSTFHQDWLRTSYADHARETCNRYRLGSTSRSRCRLLRRRMFDVTLNCTRRLDWISRATNIKDTDAGRHRDKEVASYIQNRAHDSGGRSTTACPSIRMGGALAGCTCRLRAESRTCSFSKSSSAVSSSPMSDFQPPCGGSRI